MNKMLIYIITACGLTIILNVFIKQSMNKTANARDGDAKSEGSMAIILIE